MNRSHTRAPPERAAGTRARLPGRLPRPVGITHASARREVRPGGRSCRGARLPRVSCLHRIRPRHHHRRRTATAGRAAAAAARRELLLPQDEPPPPDDEPRSSPDEEWDDPLSPTPAAPSTHQLLSLSLRAAVELLPLVGTAVGAAAAAPPDERRRRGPARAARVLRRLTAPITGVSTDHRTRMMPITAIAFMASPSPLSSESPEAAPRGRLAHLRVAGFPRRGPLKAELSKSRACLYESVQSARQTNSRTPNVWSHDHRSVPSAAAATAAAGGPAPARRHHPTSPHRPPTSCGVRRAARDARNACGF